MKINYGIYLGISSASIAKMECGIPVMLRSSTLKDTISVCVYVNRRGAIHVGDAAFNALKNEKLNAMKSWDSSKKNSFIEFTRTLGSDAQYQSSNTNGSYTSEQLVAEIIKHLLSFEKDQNISAAILTVPDTFKNNQIAAVREAGRLAGLAQVEILQESVAASFAYGLDSIKFQGFSLVLSFDDVFNVSLMKNSKVIDNEGDNYLGKNYLDESIVDQIIIPYLKENYVINELLLDNPKIITLLTVMKFYAKEIIKQLSFNKEASILTNSGDIPGEDDEGDQFELDITVTQADITKVLSPVFQKAIDISKSLIERNNLKGSSLDSLVLVGGSTLSPVLRTMLEEQICKPDTSIDPKTAIAKGAAIYASTLNISEEIREKKKDKIKILLEIGYEATSTEEEEFITIKILKDKSEEKISEKIFADISRGDGGWSSGKIGISMIGEVIGVQLQKGELNSYSLKLYDKLGKLIECEPSSFNILGSCKGVIAVLPYNIGLEIKDQKTGYLVFKTIKGLEKGKQLPATGTLKNIKTTTQIRPGVEEDFFEIPIYQGEHDCEGSRSIYNHHVNTILITGNDLPRILPENSKVTIELKIDNNQRITGLAFFPHLAFAYEFECETKIDSVNDSKAEYLDKEIKKAKSDIRNLKSEGIESITLDKVEKEIQEIEINFITNKESADTQQQTIENLRKVLRTIDKLIDEHVLLILEDELMNHTFNETEDLLFILTEDKQLSSSQFQNYYEKLSKLKKNPDTELLQSIYNQLRDYGKN